MSTLNADFNPEEPLESSVPHDHDHIDYAGHSPRFTPGVDEHYSPGTTDIDGTRYPAEHHRRLNTLRVSNEPPIALHTYALWQDGQQVHGVSLSIEDGAGEVLIDLVPPQLHSIGLWLIEQADELEEVRPA